MNFFFRKTTLSENAQAYLDGRMSAQQSSRFLEEVDQSAEAKKLLSEYQTVKGLLATLPIVNPPRDFILSPSMVGIRPPQPGWLANIQRAAAAVGVFLLATIAYQSIPSVTPTLNGGVVSVEQENASMPEAPMAFSAPAPEAMAPDEAAPAAEVPEPALRSIEAPPAEGDALGAPMMKSAPDVGLSVEVQTAAPQSESNGQSLTLGLAGLFTLLLVAIPILRKLNLETWRKGYREEK